MSCLKCESCVQGRENYCSGGIIGTYNGVYPDGSKSYGGFGRMCRVSSHFVVKIPHGLASEEAAPLLCAGVTMYSVLQRNRAGPGRRVGILGIGGVGHIGLLLAHAMDCDRVVAISRNSSKQKEAQSLGADNFIDTSAPGWSSDNERTLDLIVSTLPFIGSSLEDYLRLLRVDGQFIQVGLPESRIASISVFALVGKAVKVGGSSVGSRAEMKAMLDFVQENNIHPWVEMRAMEEANQVIVDMEHNPARYRFVLVNGDT